MALFEKFIDKANSLFSRKVVLGLPTIEEMKSKDARSLFVQNGIACAPTGYAILNGAHVSDDKYIEGNKELSGRCSTSISSSSTRNGYAYGYCGTNGFCSVGSFRSYVSRPSSPSYSILKSPQTKVIEESGFISIDGKKFPKKISYGTFPQTECDVNLNSELENMLNSGESKDFKFSYSPFVDDNHNPKLPWLGFTERLNPEFVFKGERYARVIANLCKSPTTLSNGMIVKDGDPVWVKVEPVIYTFDEISKKYVADKGLISIALNEETEHFTPFIFNNTHLSDYLNGKTRIKKVISNKNFPVTRKFKGKGFIDQIKLPHEKTPIFDYVVDNETIEIGDYAYSGNRFNSITFPKEIKKVGDNAFDLCGFKFISKTKNGEKVLSRESLAHRKDIEMSMDCSECHKTFNGFDIGKALGSEVDLELLKNLHDKLTAANRQIPYKNILKLSDTRYMQIKKFEFDYNFITYSENRKEEVEYLSFVFDKEYDYNAKHELVEEIEQRMLFNGNFQDKYVNNVQEETYLDQ